jgi:Raf kinase inhibitor-like YbhB/YbcL family protein
MTIKALAECVATAAATLASSLLLRHFRIEMKHKLPIVAAAPLLFTVLLGCAHSAPAAQTFQLTSPAFGPGAPMPDSTVLNALDCTGPNISPGLAWSNAPLQTKSFAIVLDDYEARGGDGFVHWAAYNIPASAHAIAANAGATEGDLPGGGRQAYNDFLKRSYGGPCPPEGPPHKYRFTVFALDLPTIDDAGTPMTWRKLRFIIKGHVLAQASLTGLRGHG